MEEAIRRSIIDAQKRDKDPRMISEIEMENMFVRTEVDSKQHFHLGILT